MPPTGILTDESFKYRAFISYSHRDKAWGDWLHRALESYRVPKQLVGSTGRDGAIPARLYPVFRDRDELPSSSDLHEQIRDALGQSAYLVVVCSPNAAVSPWVAAEILAFKRMGGENRILALIVDGEPNAGDEPTTEDLDELAVKHQAWPGPLPRECFPRALKIKFGPDGALARAHTEPIAADARDEGDGKENAKLKLVAGLLGVGYDALKRRDLEAQRRRMRVYQAITAAMAVLAVGAMGAGWLAFQNAREAHRQLDEALMQQSRFLASESAQFVKQDDGTTATAVALLGLPWRSNTRPLVFEADTAFQDARAADRLIAIFPGSAAPRGDLSGRQMLEALMTRSALATYSPDGKRIAIASGDDIVRIQDAVTGKKLAALPTGQGDEVISAAWSPDGKRIATVSSAERGARIWNAATGAQLGWLLVPDSLPKSAAYSPDGKHMVFATYEKTARVFDVTTGRQLAVLSGHGGPVNFAAYSPDGSRIVTASSDKTARIWVAGTGKQLTVLSGHSGVVRFAAWSPDGERIVTASDDKTARIWDAVTGKQLAELTNPSGNSVRTAKYSPDGKRIATASSDNAARIWDAATGLQLAVLSGYPGDISTAAWSPDGSRIVTASRNETAARVWDARAHRQLAVLSGHAEGVYSAVYSPDGKRIVTTSLDLTTRVWDPVTGANLPMPAAFGKGVNSAVFSPDGRRIAITPGNGFAYISDAVSGNRLAKLHAEDMYYARFAWSPDGTHLATWTIREPVRIWDVMTGKQLATLSVRNSIILSAAYSPDGKRIVTASTDKTARIWDSVTGKQLAVLSGLNDSVPSAAYSPDGKYIVTASGNSARVWDAASGKQLILLSGHTGAVLSAAYAPDGKHIVTASGDKTARIWDAVTGVQLAVLSGHTELVFSAAWSPDGKRVVTASADKTARIWEVPEIPDLDTQIAWAQAAQFEPLSDDVRKSLALPPSAAVPVAPANEADAMPQLRRAEDEDAAAAAEKDDRKRAALRLDAFENYAASCERARMAGWRDETWKPSCYRRASLARLLAQDGMMRRVADTYDQVLDKWGPQPPGIFTRIGNLFR
jgi:WD40 repeat protein